MTERDVRPGTPYNRRTAAGIVVATCLTAPCRTCAGSGLLLDNASVGALLRQERTADGYTLRQVDQRMTISIAYLSNLECGQRRWTPALIERYYAALE